MRLSTPYQGRGGFNREPVRKHKINYEIKVPEVRVIDPAGEMLGVISTREAILKAEGYEMDLVEIAPQAVPPVCKIIDYGKFAYEIAKKEKLQKKNTSQQQMKEVRFKWRTDTHDFNFKVRHAREFLGEGNKVKASVMFRGREITHKEIGEELLKKFVEELADTSKVDSQIRFEGKNLSVILAPDKIKKKEKVADKPAEKVKVAKAPKTDSDMDLDEHTLAAMAGEDLNNVATSTEQEASAEPKAQATPPTPKVKKQKSAKISEKEATLISEMGL